MKKRKDRAELIERLDEKNRLLTAFEGICQAVQPPLDADHLVSILPEQIVEAGLFRSLVVALVDEGTHTVTVKRSLTRCGTEDTDSTPREVMKQVGRAFDLDDYNIIPEVVRTGEMQIIEGWDDRHGADGEPEVLKGTVAYFVPVKFGDRVLAVLGTACREDEKEELLVRIELMNSLLVQLGIVLEHARLYKQLEFRLEERTAELNQHVKERGALLRINRAVLEMLQPSDLEQALKVCLNELDKVGLDVQSVAIHKIIDPEQLIIETFRTVPEGTISVSDRRKGRSITRCWQTGQIDYIQDLDTFDEETIRYFRSKFNDLPLRSLLDVPFSQGVISAHSIRANAFSAANVETLKRIAEVLSVSFARLEDFEQLAVRNRELIRLERLRAVGELSAGVSHNLNNILSTVVGPAQMLKRNTDDPALLEEIEDIVQSAGRASHLVRRLALSTQGEVSDSLAPVNVKPDRGGGRADFATQVEG